MAFVKQKKSMWPRRWEGRVFDQFAEAMNLKSQGCPSILMGDKHADFTLSRVLMWGLYHNLTWFDSDKWFKHWVFTSFTVQIWECCFKQTGIAWFAKEMVEQPSQKPLLWLQNFKKYFHLNLENSHTLSLENLALRPPFLQVLLWASRLWFGKSRGLICALRGELVRCPHCFGNADDFIVVISHMFFASFARFTETSLITIIWVWIIYYYWVSPSRWWHPAKPRTGMSWYFTLFPESEVRHVSRQDTFDVKRMYGWGWLYIPIVFIGGATHDCWSFSGYGDGSFDNFQGQTRPSNFLLSNLTEVFLHDRCIPHHNLIRQVWASVCVCAKPWNKGSLILTFYFCILQSNIEFHEQGGWGSLGVPHLTKIAPSGDPCSYIYIYMITPFKYVEGGPDRGAPEVAWNTSSYI